MKKQKIIMLLLVLAMSYSNYCYANNFQWNEVEMNGFGIDFDSMEDLDIVRNGNLLTCVDNTTHGMCIYTSSDKGNNWNKIYGFDDNSYPISFYFYKAGPIISINANEIILLAYRHSFIEEDNFYHKLYYLCVIDVVDYSHFDTIPMGTEIQNIEFDFINRNVGITLDITPFKTHSVLLTDDGMQTQNEIFRSDIQHISNYSIQSKDCITLLCYEQPNTTSPKINHCFYSTKDGGENWNISKLSSFIDKDYDTIGYTDFKFCNDSVGYLLGYRKKNGLEKTYQFILKTTDYGFTWTTLLDSAIVGNTWYPEYFNSIEVVDENTIVAYRDDLIIFTFDGGQTWETTLSKNVYASQCIVWDSTEIIANSIYNKKLYRGLKYTLIHEPAELSSLILYPNPTSKLINFDIPKDQILNNLELFALNGNLLCKFNTGATTLDLSAYNSGEYYLCFTLNNIKYYRSIILSK